MNIAALCISPDKTIKEAMRVIDVSGFGIALVTDKSFALKGVVTTGDLRRVLFSGKDVNEPVESYMNKEPILAHQSKLYDHSYLREIEQKAADSNANYIPIIDSDNRVVHLAHRSGLKSPNLRKHKNEHVLIVGGGGYLGTVLAQELLNQNYRVRVLDTCTFGYKPLAELIRHPNFELIKDDIRNISSLTAALKDIDSVIHLAGIVGDPASKKHPLKTIEINLLATRALAEACKYHQINRVIFASTTSVYGFGEGTLDEDSPLRPLSLYARLKMQAEDILLEMEDTNFAPIILRMGTLFGVSPRMRFDLVINLLTAKAFSEKKITIFGGEQWRPFLHVKDAAQAFISMLKAPLPKVKGEIFNVGKENIRIKQLGPMLKQAFPESEILRREGEVDKRSYSVSFEKIRDATGFEAKTSVEKGIKEIKNFVEQNSIKNFKEKQYNNVSAD